MSYYSEDEEIDIRLRQGRRTPVFDRPRARTTYYAQGDRNLEINRTSYERSRSRGPIIRERVIREPPVIDRPIIERERQIIRESAYREKEKDKERPPQPIIINNRIENRQEYDDDEIYEDERRYLPLAIPVRTRSRSRPRDREREREHDRDRDRDPAFMTREDYELERTRKELERYKLRDQREEEEKAIKKELELKRLREERKAEEEKKKKDEDERRTIMEYKAREAEKREKERKEKEEREAEYKRRMEETLRKSGMDDHQIVAVLENKKDIFKEKKGKEKEKEKEKDDHDLPSRPTYTRMARRYLSIETLNVFHIDYTVDVDPEYLLIKRWVPEWEQDMLWNHTRDLRERRQPQPMVLAIEEKKTHHHHLRDDEFEIVRKHKRKSSPSPLLTFIAGKR